MPDQTVYPCLYVVSDDYMSLDTGEDGGYDDSLRALFPDLDFGTPDQVKRLLFVEVVYQSLKELPVTVTCWYRKPLGDSGSASDSVTYETEVTTGNEPGVLYGTSDPEWGTDSYATLRTFSTRCDLEQATGKSFDVGLVIDSNLIPCKVLKLAFHISTTARGHQGSTVLGSTP